MSVLQDPASQLPSVCNQLLEHLLRKQQNEVLAACEVVDLSFGDILCEPEKNLPYVYFPLTAFFSLVGGVSDHPLLEMGLIGNEGMLGSTLVTGVKSAPLQAVVQGPGTALRMSITRFTRELRTNVALATVVGRYLHVQMQQISQTIACTRFHSVEARLARWLLTTHDRAHADNFHFTHQFLADMLGVQRSAVTISAGIMQEQDLISYSRGEINIRNRKGLEAVSCECYEAGIAVYQNLLT